MTADAPVTRRRLLAGAGTLGLGSLAGCLGVLNTGSADSDSSESIHWHVTLGIVVDGEPHPVPKDVGIGSQYADSPYYHEGMQMTSIHTHDDSGTLHWEIMGRPLMEGEHRLGAFFDIWGEPFSATRLLEHTTDDGTLTMHVNGSPTDQFDDYAVQHGDEVQIRFDAY